MLQFSIGSYVRKISSHQKGEDCLEVLLIQVAASERASKMHLVWLMIIFKRHFSQSENKNKMSSFTEK